MRTRYADRRVPSWSVIATGPSSANVIDTAARATRYVAAKAATEERMGMRATSTAWIAHPAPSTGRAGGPAARDEDPQYPWLVHWKHTRAVALRLASGFSMEPTSRYTDVVVVVSWHSGLNVPSPQEYRTPYWL